MPIINPEQLWQQPLMTLAALLGLLVAFKMAAAVRREIVEGGLHGSSGVDLPSDGTAARSPTAGNLPSVQALHAEMAGAQGVSQTRRRGDLLYELFSAVGDFPLLVSWRGTGRTGLGRAAVIAANTVREALRRRLLWIVPAWFVTALGVGAFLRPFDEELDTYPLVCRLMMVSQAVVVVATTALLAAVDLSNERRHRTLLTLMVKPVTALEVMLGKLVGHSLTALLLAGVMGGLTYGYMLYLDGDIRAAAEQRYARMAADHQADPTRPAPEVGLKLLSERGVLKVSHIQRPRGPASIYSAEVNAIKFVRSGSGMKIIARFPPMQALDPAEAPKLVVNFSFRPIPTILQRDHGRRIDPRTGQLMLALKFNCVFSPDGNPFNGVGVTYPLRETEEIKEQLPAAELVRMQNLRQNRVEFVATDPRVEFPFTAVFPVPQNSLNGSPFEASVSCDAFGLYMGVKTTDAMRIYGAVPDNGLLREDGSVSPIGPVQYAGAALRKKPSIMGISKADDPSVPPNEVPGRKNYYPPDRAVWTFDGVTAAADDKPVRLVIKALVDVNDKNFTETAIQVRFDQDFDQASGRARKSVDSVIEENRPINVEVPRELLNGRPFTAMLLGRTTGHSIGLDEASVRLEAASEPYWWALAKTELLIWALASLLAAVGLWAGSFLNWAIAVLMLIFVLVLGLFREHLLPLGVEHEMWRTLYVMDPGQKETVVLSILKWAVFGLGRLIGLCGFLSPDFRSFREFELLAGGVAASWQMLGRDIGGLWGYAAIFMTGGYIALRARESTE